jgi:FG-GAP-like repeat
MRVLIVLACLTACYQPTVASCQYTCGEGSACPDGQSCMGGLCVAPGDTCSGSSGGSDAPDVPTGLSPAAGVYTGSYLASTSLMPTFKWSAVDGASYYELDLDSTCNVPKDCAFTGAQVIHVTPIVGTSSTQALTASSPVGLRYGWRLRACNGAGCSDWTATRYLNVGRLRDDFDGDGKSDLAIGTEKTVTVRVFSDGAETGTTVACGPGHGEVSFGTAIAAGDFNGDGYADFAVTGILPTSPPSDDITTFPGGMPEPCPGAEEQIVSSGSNVYIGDQIAGVGDLDGDGYDDLVVSEIVGTTPELDVYFGTISGLDLENSVTIQLPMSPVSFGSILVYGMGDIDGDGYLDAAFSLGSGSVPSAVVVVPGSPSRQFSATTMLSDPGTSQFGGRIAIVDLDGDGLADLFVNEQDSTGDKNATVVAYHSSGSGLSEWKRFQPNPPDNTLGSLMIPLAVGGAAELAVGDGQNAVVVIDASLDASTSSVLDPGNPGDDGFGATLGAGDFEGSGLTALAVGAEKPDSVGEVFVCPRTTPDPTGFVCTTIADPDPISGDEFGIAVSP